MQQCHGGVSTHVLGLAELAGCSTADEDCSATKCCKRPDYACFAKNDHWASCNETCTPGINLQDPKEHQTEWSCQVLGGPGNATCGTDHGDCRQSKCCQSNGMSCYVKNDHWANCNITCTPGINANDPKEHQTPWSCEVLGGATPAPAPA